MFTDELFTMDPRGRSRRLPYFCAVMSAFFGIAVITVLQGLLGFEKYNLGKISVLCFGLWATIVQIRRLHDVNWSGWWAVVFLLPLNVLLMVYLFFAPGTSGPNRFGVHVAALRFARGESGVPDLRRPFLYQLKNVFGAWLSFRFFRLLVVFTGIGFFVGFFGWVVNVREARHCRRLAYHYFNLALNAEKPTGDSHSSIRSELAVEFTGLYRTMKDDSERFSEKASVFKDIALLSLFLPLAFPIFRWVRLAGKMW